LITALIGHLGRSAMLRSLYERNPEETDFRA
jgi:hypothetical protein